VGELSYCSKGRHDLCHRWAGYDSMASTWVDQAMWHQYADLMTVYWKGKKRIKAVSRDRKRKMDTYCLIVTEVGIGLIKMRSHWWCELLLSGVYRLNY
jgi:hypothetical protein